MSASVTDLLSRRARRGKPVLHFRTAAEALIYASGQVRDLEQLAASALLLDARELDLPLAQLSAVLTECIRLHTSAQHSAGHCLAARLRHGPSREESA